MSITYLGEVTNNGLMRSPLQVLEATAQDIEQGQLDVTKLIVIGLNDKDGYSVKWRQAGMKCSEMLALLEIAKQTVLAEMGY